MIKLLKQANSILLSAGYNAYVEFLDNNLPSDSGYRAELSRIRSAFDEDEPTYQSYTPYSIFTIGNSKLPFLSFSALPGEGFCPGAGDCLNFCFSFKAWRYPKAYFRQVQNTLLLSTKEGKARILSALDYMLSRRKFKGKRIDFRLYVDGDFQNIDVLNFWMDALSDRPQVNAYGYSKSIELFVARHNSQKDFPDNYTLNLSSGGTQSHLFDQVKSIPNLVRGEFVASPIKQRRTVSSSETKAEIRKWASENYEKYFICPGKCGECLFKRVDGVKVNNHACGDIRIQHPIIIHTH